MPSTSSSLFSMASGPKVPSMLKSPGTSNRIKPLLDTHTPKALRQSIKAICPSKQGSPDPIKKKECLATNMKKVASDLTKERKAIDKENFYAPPSREKAPKNNNLVEPHIQLADNSNLTITFKLSRNRTEQLVLRSDPSTETPQLTYKAAIPRERDEELPVAKRVKKYHIVEPHLVGFRNQGATCYLNSVLQALSGLDNFSNDVLEEMPMMSSQLCPLQSLLRLRQKGCEEQVYTCLRELHARFAKEVNQNFVNNYDQQDLDEFLTLYLDKIDTEIKEKQKELELNSPTLVEKNFTFNDTEKRVCINCQNEIVSNQSNCLMRLSLTEEGGKKSIQQLVESAMDSSFDECPSCRTQNCVKTSRKFTRLPRTLLMILMRYNNNGQKLDTPVTISPYLVLDSFLTDNCIPPFSSKVSAASFESIKPEMECKAVQTDLDILEIENPDTPETDTEEMKEAMSASMFDQDRENREEDEMKKAIDRSIADQDPFTWKPFANALYRLSAVVNHFGDTSNSGHYKADVFRKDKSQWFNYNDLSVKSKTAEQVLSKGEDVCYLLVYNFEGDSEALLANPQHEQKDAEAAEEMKGIDKLDQFIRTRNECENSFIEFTDAAWKQNDQNE